MCLCGGGGVELRAAACCVAAACSGSASLPLPRHSHPPTPSHTTHTHTHPKTTTNHSGGVKALKGTTKTGQMVMSPQGVMHFFYNPTCEGVTMFHTFPTSTTEDFFSLWASVDQMDDPYLNSVLPGLAGSLHADFKKEIPDGIHTVNTQCMQRCGIKADYWKYARCPADAPGTPNIYKTMPYSG